MRKYLLTLCAISLLNLSSYSQATVELVKDINPNGGAYPALFGELNNKLLFIAYEGDGNHLWISDGSAIGTNPLKAINPNGSSNIASFTKYNGKLYFEGTDGTNSGIWATDGTSAGTTIITTDVTNITQSYNAFFEYNGKLYFNGEGDTHGEQLWVTDGTESGTQLVKVINPSGNTHLSGFTELNGKLYFYANEESHGNQLWESDGTAAGTKRVALINPNGDGFIISMPKKFNNKLYFGGDDGSNGSQLWVTDGTSEGTQMVKKINFVGDSQPYGFTEYNGKLYFAAYDGNDHQLWETDGTSAGTSLIKYVDINLTNTKTEMLVEVNGKLYFSGNDGTTNGNQLWVTNGTSAGTKKVKTINPTGNSNPRALTKLGEKLYFVATKGNHNYELFESDGTELGTKVISPDAVSNIDPCIHTFELFKFKNALYFRADYTDIGQELYRVVDHSISIKEQPEVVSFSAYPNPTYDKLTITTEKSTSFALLDLTGKILLTFEVNQEKEISIAELNTGVYILRNETSGSHKKIVKY